MRRWQETVNPEKRGSCGSMEFDQTIRKKIPGEKEAIEEFLGHLKDLGVPGPIEWRLERNKDYRQVSDGIIWLRAKGHNWSSQRLNGVIEAAAKDKVRVECAVPLASAILGKSVDLLAPDVFDRAAELDDYRFRRRVQEAGHTKGEYKPPNLLDEDIAKEIKAEFTDKAPEKKAPDPLEIVTSETREERPKRRRGRPRKSESAKASN